jgi:uncharacterized membrane protein
MGHRAQYALERLALFSDAVFAIAITLLVIEIRALHVMSDHEAVAYLRESIPKFFGFALSFLVIGIYWVSHHRLFSFLVKFNIGVLWLNLLVLFTVTLMPFSTAFYSENFSYTTPYLWYSANVAAARLWAYVSSPARALVVGMENRRVRKYFFLSNLIGPAIWSAGFLLGVVEFYFPSVLLTTFSRSIYVLLFPASFILRRRYKDVRDEVRIA